MKDIIFDQIRGLEAELTASRDKCIKAGRSPSVSERNRAREILAEMKNLEESYQLEVDLEARDPQRQSVRQPLKPIPGDQGGGYRPTTAPSGGLRGPQDSKTYEAIFGRAQNNDGWRNSNEFFRAVCSGQHHPKLRAALTEGGPPSEGGFLVPTEYSREIHDVALEDEVVMPRCRVQPMASNTIELPAFEIGSHASHLYSGLVAYWKGEATELEEATPKVRQMELNAKKLTVLMRYSSEWQEDAPGGEAAITRVAGKGLGWYRDLALLKGTGAGQPLGVLRSPALIVVNKEAVQLADTLVYENLVNMLARLHPSCWRNSVWVIHPTVIPQLLTLGIMVGMGGAFYPVLKEDSGQFSILGRPVIFSEKMEPIGDQGDVLLADFSQYVVGLRRDLSFAVSPFTYFTSDQWAARLICRLDGQSLWNTALTMPDGVNTLSPFIVLQAR
jgi:HK97 family phage major capsid protein